MTRVALLHCHQEEAVGAVFHRLLSSRCFVPLKGLEFSAKLLLRGFEWILRLLLRSSYAL